MITKKRRMLINLVIVVIALSGFALFGFISCSTSGNGNGGGTTITGTVTDLVGTDPVVALFDETYWFSASGDDDAIDSETKGQTPPFTPHIIATINGGSYSVVLPEGSDGTNLFLIAWDDTNQDSKFELTESGVFPMKLFDQGTFPVEYIRYTEIMGYGEWSVYYYDGDTIWLLGLSIAGTSGYNFTID